MDTSKTNYILGDFLIRIKNAQMAKNKEITIKNTKVLLAISNCLKKASFLDKVEVGKDGDLVVSLAYVRKEAKLQDLKLISKPGLRVYITVDELLARRKPGSLIVSTSKGIVIDKEAIKLGLGGELIAEII